VRTDPREARRHRLLRHADAGQRGHRDHGWQTLVVHMDREALNDYPLGLYGVTAEIVTFEPDQQIAWILHGQLDLSHVYGYRLEPIEEGTLVTSYHDWPAAQQA
jgi:hypothetical protein